MLDLEARIGYNFFQELVRIHFQAEHCRLCQTAFESTCLKAILIKKNSIALRLSR